MPANKTQGSQVALHAIPSEATLVDVSQSQGKKKERQKQ